MAKWRTGEDIPDEAYENDTIPGDPAKSMSPDAQKEQESMNAATKKLVEAEQARRAGAVKGAAGARE